jgi:hypothetical protein
MPMPEPPPTRRPILTANDMHREYHAVENHMHVKPCPEVKKGGSA